MEGVSFVLVGATIAKICAFGAGVTVLSTGIKWFNTFDPSFKKKSKEVKLNDDISDHTETLRKKIRA
jgi:hypothetical protein